MAPQTRILAARILIPVALVIAGLAANIGSWVVVAAMAPLIFSQVVNLRAGRGQLSRRNVN
jgi:hypothetical protein